MARVWFYITLVSAALAAPMAQAACYADYKAKRDNPLRLHYGVMMVDVTPCESSNSVSADVSRRLEAAGWKLLKVESVFDKASLDSKKADAGEYFLRF